MRRAFLIWLCLSALADPSLCSGQGGQINGVIADPIAGRRVPGAVVTVFDSARTVLKQALADDSGRFRIEDVPTARRIRILKIGYRPSEMVVTPPMSVRFNLERLPSLLEPVRTSDQPRCSRNATRPAAFGLWEQARAALLGAVIARSTNTATVTRVNFTRYMSPRSDEIRFQAVRRETSLSLRSFDAVFPATEFMRRGFAEPAGGSQILFYGPDAEVLLDDALAEHYCLELAGRKAERPTQVGLRFRPMARERGRVDIDGTLWIDTLARTLSDVEYTYLGLSSWATPLRPGGRISFEETSPATVWIDQWTIRMTGAAIDVTGRPTTLDFTLRPHVVEGGAELASAVWPDGRQWKATLSDVALKLVTRGGAPLVGARVRLDSTDYSGITDSVGSVMIDDVLPGPYRVSVLDSTLAIVDTALPAATGFVATRGVTANVVTAVPTLGEFVTQECLANEVFTERSYMLVARIVAGRDSVPAYRAKWRIETPAGANDMLVPSGIYGHGETGANGMVYFCTRLNAGRRVILRAWPAGDKAEDAGTEVTVTLRDRITAVKLVLPP